MAKVFTIYTCTVGEGAGAVEHPPGKEINVSESVAGELIAAGAARRATKAPKAEADAPADVPASTPEVPAPSA